MVAELGELKNRDGASSLFSGPFSDSLNELSGAHQATVGKVQAKQVPNKWRESSTAAAVLDAKTGVLGLDHKILDLVNQQWENLGHHLSTYATLKAQHVSKSIDTLLNWIIGQPGIHTFQPCINGSGTLNRGSGLRRGR